MAAILILRKQEVEVPAGQKIREAAQSLGIHWEHYVAVREGEVVCMDETLREGDVVRLVAAVSGG